MKKGQKKGKMTPEEIPEEILGRMLDMSEFAEIMEVDWGNPLGTNLIKSKPKPKSKEVIKK